MNFDDDDLQEWRESKRVNITSSRDPLVNSLLDACRNGSEVNITYFGGTTPGESRTICPVRVFRVRGYDSIYVEAFCKTRGENRTFRLDRINQENREQFVKRSWRRNVTDRPYNEERGTIHKASPSGSGCLLFIIVGSILAVLVYSLLFG